MNRLRVVLFGLMLPLAIGLAQAQDLSLLPKYGEAPKTADQTAADEKLLRDIDERYKGDRKRAATELASQGWRALQNGSADEAMRRFNQAWLTDRGNGPALWGMAAVVANSGKIQDSLPLFAEAERTLADDIDFAVDYARATGYAAAEDQNKALFDEAFRRFANVHAKAPQHVLNLQNWAIALFYAGNYAEAWNKVKLAEQTPDKALLDPEFIRDLQAKMPRP